MALRITYNEAYTYVHSSWRLIPIAFIYSELQITIVKWSADTIHLLPTLQSNKTVQVIIKFVHVQTMDQSSELSTVSSVTHSFDVVIWAQIIKQSWADVLCFLLIKRFGFYQSVARAAVLI